MLTVHDFEECALRLQEQLSTMFIKSYCMLH